MDLRPATISLTILGLIGLADAAPPSESPTPRPIAVFQDLDARGASRTARMNELRSERGLLLLGSAVFDPVRQGAPDFHEYVPERVGWSVLPPTAERHVIVQFDHGVAAAELAALRAEGLEPLFYVPNDAYLVRGGAVAMERMRSRAGVRWIGRLKPGFRVERALGVEIRSLQQPSGPENPTGEHWLRVLLTPGADPEAFADTVETELPTVNVIGTVSSRGIAVVVLRTTRGTLANETIWLANREEVLWVETWKPAEPATDDAVWILQSYDRVNQRDYALTTTVWNHGIQGAGQILGISDTGVDPDACWFIDTANGIVPASAVPVNGPGAGPIPLHPEQRKIIGYNTVGWFDAPNTAYDQNGHGTFTAGNALGDDHAHLADESITDGSHHDTGDGMAPLAKVVVEDMHSDAFPCSDGRICPPEIVDDMFVQMYEAGARIGSNSWGIETEYGIQSFLLDRMTWTYPDFLNFFVAGNGGPEPETLVGSTAKDVVIVGGAQNGVSTEYDPENLHVGSSRGPTSDGRIKPDVVTLYGPIVGAWSDAATTGENCTTMTLSGTSLATPLGAGAALLVREYFTEGWYPSGAKTPADGFTPSAALIKGVLLNGARNMTGNGGGDVGPCFAHVCSSWPSANCDTNADCVFAMDDDAPSPYQGYGRVMLEDGLYFAGDDRDLRVWDVPRGQGLSTGDSWSAQFHVASDTETLEVVLTWSDPPALVAADSFLVNDLDLRLVAPDGTEYWGNSLEARDGDNTTVEQTEPNVRKVSRIDNVEYARRLAGGVTPGVWTVEVLGTNVPGSPWMGDSSLRQDFAVIVTGDLSDTGGTVSLDSERYSCADTVTVRVDDSNAAGSVSAVLTTDSGDSESLVLSAVGGGVYTAALSTSGATAIVPGNGTLEVVQGETIRATYADSTPVVTSSDDAVVTCKPDLRLGTVSISGGCDGDGYLDAGEEVALEVSLVNATTIPAMNVRARLSSPGAEVHVRPGEGTFGNIVPGGSGSNGATPFLVSAPATTAPLSEVTLRLEVTADGQETPLVLDLPLTLEADEVVTQGSWSESFDTAVLSCAGRVCSGNSSIDCESDSDCTGVGLCTGLTPVPAGDWSYVDLDGDCGTNESNWDVRACNGDSSATLPSCNQSVDGPGPLAYWLVSPVIETGNPGSTTFLEQIVLTERVIATLNDDGGQGDQALCDQVRVWIRSVPDDDDYATEYVRVRSVDLSEATTTVGFSGSTAWTVPPLPDTTRVQILLSVYLDYKPPSPFPVPIGSCSQLDTESVRWLVRDLTLSYENREIVADISAPCSPGCTDPAVPTGVTASELDPGVMSVAWDPVAGADHYDLYRARNAGPPAFLGRALAPRTTFLDTISDDATYGYTVRAVSQNGLCESADSAVAQRASTGPCRLPPSAPTGLAVTNDAIATCSQSLSWNAAVVGCVGDSVQYRIYRDVVEDMVPGPHNLLATVSGTSFVDTQLAAGYDSGGEPVGTEYFYVVRAVDAATGVEDSNLQVVSSRAGGPAIAATWSDDGGDLTVSKMTFTTAVDENQVGAGWSRTASSDDHQADGTFTYWTGADPAGDGEYENLACTRLETPPLELAPGGASQLGFWVNYRIDYQRDGLVIDLSANGGPFSPLVPVGGYPSDFSRTEAPPCVPSGGSGSWVNACGYAPAQGAINGPPPDASVFSGWEQYTFDLGTYQGDTVVIRFNLSSDCNTKGSAIVDEIEVTDVLRPTDCAPGSCLPAPSFAGVASAVDLDPTLDTGVRITWGSVADWGGGGAGGFKVYRSGVEIASLVSTASSHDDNAAPDNRRFDYVVQAVSGGGCDLTDGNLATLSGVDCVEASPAAVDAAVLTVGKAETVILRSTTIPSAGAYRFFYSHDPSSVTGAATVLDSATPEARHDVLTDSLDYYYLVEDGPSEACAEVP